MRKACRLILLIFVLWVPATCQAADEYDDVLDKQLAPDPKVTALEKALLAQGKMIAKGPEIDPPPPSATYYGLVVAVGLLFVGAFAFLNWRFNPLNLFRSPTAAHLQTFPVEDPTLGAFFNELRDGLSATAHQSVAPLHHSLNGAQPGMLNDPVGAAVDAAPSRIANFRTLFSEISRAPDAASRRKTLLEFSDQVRSLKESCRMPALHPVWLLASALEGLLNQLSREACDFTASAQRTAAGAVDLLEALCVRGLDPNLATEPQIRILAVDDDAVSRLAISFALKKAFNEPYLAPEGEAALALAVQQRYDVIFLDVEMPGMDGFELCTKIHETVRNRMTPVVFVTRHSDFGSRAKSSVSGGRDLIAKPYLVFEITVKALTLALRGRLENGAVESGSANKAASGATKWDEAARAFASLAAIAPSTAPVAPPSGEALSKRTEEEKEQKLRDPSSSGLRELSQNDGADAFFNQTLSQLDELRNRLEAVRHATEPADLQKSLSQLYIGVHSFSSDAERAELRAIFKLSSALEGMLLKLLEHTKSCAPSTLDATVAAIELLEDLCLAEANPDLAHPPIRLLVVDDDPVACRAISGSLQLVFGRPDSADSGEEAVKLAARNPFDLIFLDLLMPGLDGFTTCARIHETASNSRTPIVFVTNHDNTADRSQVAAAGGCGFIPKPVLPSQITLTALTFILRARLDKLEPIHAIEEPASLTMA